MPETYPRGDDPLPAELNACFEEFFSAEESRERGQDTYDDIFTSPLLFPLQRKRELAHMMQVARDEVSPRVVFEIGADKGGGLYHWCKSLVTVERVICCEIRGTPYRHLFEDAFPNIDFLWLPQSSYSSATRLQVCDWLGDDRIDCMFVDGDKSHFDLDFFTYRSLMATGGIVFMHDIQDAYPRRGYDISIQEPSHEEYINTTESDGACEREKAGTKSSSVHEDWLRHWKGKSAGVGIIRL